MPRRGARREGQQGCLHELGQALSVRPKKFVGPTTEQEIVELIRDARCVKVRPAAPRLGYPDLPRTAEEIMNEGRSSHYDEAVTWLAKARDAHLAAGREKEWRAYLEELIARHRRKYKLRPMLEDLA